MNDLDLIRMLLKQETSLRGKLSLMRSAFLSRTYRRLLMRATNSHRFYLAATYVLELREAREEIDAWIADQIEYHDALEPPTEQQIEQVVRVMVGELQEPREFDDVIEAEFEDVGYELPAPKPWIGPDGPVDESVFDQ